MVTAATRPHVFWVGEDQERVSGWPVGAALLAMLSEANADVQKALADERTQLRLHGYPEDLGQPALWWNPAPPSSARTPDSP